jgi:hypothetical protein
VRSTGEGDRREAVAGAATGMVLARDLDLRKRPLATNASVFVSLPLAGRGQGWGLPYALRMIE